MLTDAVMEVGPVEGDSGARAAAMHSVITTNGIFVGKTLYDLFPSLRSGGGFKREAVD